MNAKRMLFVLPVLLIALSLVLVARADDPPNWQTLPLEHWTIQDGRDAREHEWGKLNDGWTEISGPTMETKFVAPGESFIMVTSEGICTTSAGTWSRTYHQGHQFWLVLTNYNQDPDVLSSVSCEGLPTQGASFAMYRLDEVVHNPAVAGLSLLEPGHCGWSCILVQISHLFDEWNGEDVLEEEEFRREDMLYDDCTNTPPGFVCNPEVTPTPTSTPTATATNTPQPPTPTPTNTPVPPTPTHTPVSPTPTPTPEPTQVPQTFSPYFNINTPDGGYGDEVWSAMDASLDVSIWSVVEYTQTMTLEFSDNIDPDWADDDPGWVTNSDGSLGWVGELPGYSNVSLLISIPNEGIGFIGTREFEMEVMVGDQTETLQATLHHPGLYIPLVQNQ